MRQYRLSGSMSGMWKRSMVRLVRHWQTKGPATDRPHLNHRATSRLYPLNTNWYFSIVLEITRPSTLKLHKPLGQCLIDMECYPIALV